MRVHRAVAIGAAVALNVLALAVLGVTPSAAARDQSVTSALVGTAVPDEMGYNRVSTDEMGYN
jgi:hypothetical protein